MAKHICKNCDQTYNYCGQCRISPIAYKEAGFCSMTCAANFKNKQKEVVQTEDVEVVITDRDTSTS